MRAPSRTALIVLSYVAALCFTLTMAFRQPVFSRVDEAQHADVVLQYLHGTYPAPSGTLIRPETFRLMQETGVYTWFVNDPVPSAGPPNYASPPVGVTTAARRAWNLRHAWQYSYEAQQPPLFYALALPFWLLGTRLHGSLGGVLALRAFNAVLAALLVPLTILLGELLGLRRAVLASAAAMTAVLPGWLLNATQVTNDTLAAVLSTLALLLSVRILRQGTSRNLLIALTASAGLAVVAKPITVALWIPAFAVLIVRRVAWREVVLTTAGTVIPALAWVGLNLHAYGHPLPSGGQIFALPGASLGIGPAAYVVTSFINVAGGWWIGDPLDLTFGKLYWLAAIASFIALLGLIGLSRALRRSDSDRRSSLFLLTGAVALQALLGLVVTAWFYGAFLPTARYVYPVLVAMSILLALGLWYDFGERAATRWVPWTLTVLCAGGTLLYLGSPPGASPATIPPTGSQILPISAVAESGGFTVSLDRLAIARDGQAWVRVVAINDASDAVEWDGYPAGVAIGGRYYAVARSQTPLAGSLAPRARSSGWLALQGPILLGPNAQPAVSATFENVASANYKYMRAVMVSGACQCQP